MATETERLISVFEARTAQFEQAVKRMDATTTASMEKQAAAVEKLNKSIARASDQTAMAGDSAAAAAPQSRALVSANQSLALSAAVAAAKISLFAISLGVWPGRIGKAVRALQLLRFATIGAVAAIGTAVAISLKAIPAFAGWERRMLTITQVILSTGGAAGRTAQDIDRLENAISKTTLATGEQVNAAAAQLLTFRSIAGETFDRTLRAAQDLAAVGFGTVSSSAVQLGKALEDPEKGLSALRRVGVSFTATQRAMIRNFVETGRTADAQRVILKAVEQQVGGAGGAQASGLSGAYHALTEETGDWFEIIGAGVSKAIRLNAVLRAMASGVAAINRAMEETDTSPLGAARRRLAELQAGAPFETKSGFPARAGVNQKQIADVQALIAELERFDRLDAKRVQDQARRAQTEAARGRFEGEIDRLNREAEAIRRTELAKQQFNAVKRASVAVDSEEADRIRGLVAQNFEFAKAQEAAAKATKKAASEQESAAEGRQKLIEDLQFERSLIGLSNTEREVEINLRRAGAGATAMQRDQIRQLTQETNNQAAAQEALRATGEQVGSSVAGGFEDAIIKGKELSDVVRGLAEDMARLLFRQTVTKPLSRGLGNIFAGFAGGSQGISLPNGSVIPNFTTSVTPAVGFATGGSFKVGGSGGPDSERVSFDATPGEIVEVRKGNPGMRDGVSVPIVVNLDARGASPDAVAGIGVQLANLKRDLPNIIANTVSTARVLRPESV